MIISTWKAYNMRVSIAQRKETEGHKHRHNGWWRRRRLSTRAWSCRSCCRASSPARALAGAPAGPSATGRPESPWAGGCTSRTGRPRAAVDETGHRAQIERGEEGGRAREGARGVGGDVDMPSRGRGCRKWAGGALILVLLIGSM